MDLTLSDRRKQRLHNGQASDEQLDVSPGTQAHFEELFERHWEGLCRTLTNLVGDPDEAQDLVLAAFIKLYDKPPPERRNLGGWLYRVASNLGINALRARKRRQQYEERAGALALETNAPLDPAAALERRQEQAQVRQTLAMMKRRSAQILILRHSGLSYAEIAAAMDVKASSVGTLLARAEREFEGKYEVGGR